MTKAWLEKPVPDMVYWRKAFHKGGQSMETGRKSLSNPALRAILVGMLAGFAVCTVIAARWVDPRSPGEAVNLSFPQ